MSGFHSNLWAMALTSKEMMVIKAEIILCIA